MGIFVYSEIAVYCIWEMGIRVEKIILIIFGLISVEIMIPT